ncbi:MAG: signal peptidase II [Gammaproteobacteria bacterium]|nr:signal peptidase II [Gammaproteobacteria bacterium]
MVQRRLRDARLPRQLRHRSALRRHHPPQNRLLQIFRIPRHLSSLSAPPPSLLGLQKTVTTILTRGASNLYDRIINEGAVIDFLNIGVGVIRTGIFNVADMAIMLGGLLVLFAHFYTSKERQKI